MNKEYKRFFAFGCSFTKYKWPTWADILGRSFDLHYNFGRSGCGNYYILNQLISAFLKYKFDENDLIIIQWTSFTREDRYIKGNWETHGGIFSSKFFDENFLTKYADEDHYIMRDLMHITCAYEILEKTKCKFIFTSMSPLFVSEDKETYLLNFENLISDYKKYIDYFIPSFKEVIFDNDWPHERGDYHPTPLEHLTYLKNILIPAINSNIIINENYIKKQVLPIENYFEKHNAKL